MEREEEEEESQGPVTNGWKVTSGPLRRPNEEKRRAAHTIPKRD